MDDWRRELGPLGTVATADVRDICVDGQGRTWVDSGGGFRDAGIRLTERDVRHIGTALIERGGGRVDDSRPVGDAAIVGEVRVHLVLPPVARRGPLLSIRLSTVHHRRLETFNFQSDDARHAILTNSTLIAGLTGSGKTTLAAALLSERPTSERIIIVEDIAELTPDHPHCVHLTSAPPNTEGAGALSLAQLVSEALRMRPDVLALGEIRGTEIADFFSALTAGHHGVSTIHADSIEHVPARLTGLCLRAGIPINAIAPLVMAATPVVAVCTRDGGDFSVSVGRFQISAGELSVATM